LQKQNLKKKKVRMCKYCEAIFPESQLLKKMTLFMIIQTDKHLMVSRFLVNLQHRGKNFDWLIRSDIKDLDTIQLYEEHKVCLTCYYIYLECQKLKVLGYRFAQKIGILVAEESKQQAFQVYSVGHCSAREVPNVQAALSSNLQKRGSSLLQGGSPKAEQPFTCKVRQNAEMVIVHNKPKINNLVVTDLYRYRIMILINLIQDVPCVEKDWQDESFVYTSNYYLEYTIMEQSQRYKLDFPRGARLNQTEIQILVNKMRVFYFFVR